MIERLQTNQRMSRIVKYNGIVYLCGQVGDGATVAEQTEDCLGRVDRLLREAGSSRDHILQAIVWLADMADFDEMNAVWRACGEAKLANTDLQVEIIVTAAVIEP